MSATRSRRRLRPDTLILIALVGAAAWFWWRGLQPRSTLELLLNVLPADQAMVGYVDVPALRRAPTLGPWLDAKLAAQGDVAPLAAGVRGVSVSLGSDSIYLATALDLSEAAAVSYLAQRRAGCSQPLDAAVCSNVAAKGGYVSMRLLDENLLAIAHSADPKAADRLGAGGQSRDAEVASARRALDEGAVVWAGLDPRRLDEVMRNPPEGWVNLSLVARALGPASSASLAARETEDGIVIELRAACADEAAAEELRAVLSSLNKMAGGLLAAGGGRPSVWQPALESFQARAEGPDVEAVWTLPVAALAGE